MNISKVLTGMIVALALGGVRDGNAGEWAVPVRYAASGANRRGKRQAGALGRHTHQSAAEGSGDVLYGNGAAAASGWTALQGWGKIG